MNLDGKTPQDLDYPSLTQLEMSDRWILSRFNQVIKQTDEYLDNYGLGEAAKGLYEFIWGDFCDWYIELVKTRLRQDADSPSRIVVQQTLAYVLEVSSNYYILSCPTLPRKFGIPSPKPKKVVSPYNLILW